MHRKNIPINQTGQNDLQQINDSDNSMQVAPRGTAGRTKNESLLPPSGL